MDFAVTVVLDAPGKARWVLAVDRERLLLADDDGTLHWVSMRGCALAKVASPDQPRLVIPMQPQQASKLAMPHPTAIRGNHG